MLSKQKAPGGTNNRMRREELAPLVNPLFATYGRMTVRQVYYQLVSGGHIPNSLNSYKNFDWLLTRCREDGLINAGNFIEGSRPVENFGSRGYTGLHSYLNAVAVSYHRDPLQGQKYQVELWIEKDALRRFIMAGLDLPIPNLATRGYSPYTLLYEARLRAARKPLVILQLGDHDPSGVDILRDIEEKVPQATVERVCLTPGQVAEYQLPPLPAKSSDTRHRGFVARHGDASVELDALPPDALIGLVRDAVDHYVDQEQVDRVAGLEDKENEKLAEWLEKLGEVADEE